MDNNLIMFRSLTLANRSKDILNNHGIRARLVRTPAHLRKMSCGYSLLIRREFGRAIDILKRHNVPIVGVAGVDFP